MKVVIIILLLQRILIISDSFLYNIVSTISCHCSSSMLLSLFSKYNVISFFKKLFPISVFSKTYSTCYSIELFF